MEQSKQAPCIMKVEIGGVEYTYKLKEKEEDNKCPFEIGDVIISQNEELCIFEGVDYFDNVYRTMSYNASINSFENRGHTQTDERCLNEYTKATPEQEELFKQKCFENEVWFDRKNKKWSPIKEGGCYTMTDVYGNKLVFIFKKADEGYIYDYASLLIDADEEELYTNDFELARIKDLANISEATCTEILLLLRALERDGKQWNTENNCIEDLKWVPTIGDRFYYINSYCEILGLTYYDDKYPYNMMVEIGNCFKTEEEAKKAVEYIKECWKNYKQ